LHSSPHADDITHLFTSSNTRFTLTFIGFISFILKQCNSRSLLCCLQLLFVAHVYFCLRVFYSSLSSKILILENPVIDLLGQARQFA